MATTKKKASVKKVAAPKTRKVRPISIQENIEIPPMVKESKYPWGELAEATPKEKNFFIECESEEEANRLRSSVYSSGRNYYLKRKIARVPVVRVIQVGDSFGVGAWSVADDTKA